MPSGGSSPAKRADRMGQVHKRESAKRDLVDHFVYLAENASIETAERFLSRAESSFLGLARHPRMGPVLAVHHEELQGIRKWRVQDFENFLISTSRMLTE
jgi:toxin ParE1/3/4